MTDDPRQAVDWSTWLPTDRATLVFVFDDARVLLIRKKRGLGAGKVNGPGGRLEAGESEEACARREVQEELCISVGPLERLGELSFQFVDGYGLHATVFRADSHQGTATETSEAVPLWTPVDALPYDEMWADDRLWLPYVVARRSFSGRFVFDGDAMLSHDLRPA